MTTVNFNEAKLKQRSACCQSFVESVLKDDFEKRPSAVEALRDEWFLQRDNQFIIGQDVVEGVSHFGAALEFQKMCCATIGYCLSLGKHQDGVRRECQGFDTSGDG